MPRQITRADKRIRIYPVDGVSLYPWKPIEQEVSAVDWRLLSAYKPPPFTDQPPGSLTEPGKPTEPTEQVGSSDSEGSE